MTIEQAFEQYWATEAASSTLSKEKAWDIWRRGWEAASSSRPARGRDNPGDRTDALWSIKSLPSWMAKAVDEGERDWQDGNCRDVECGCVTEHIKLALSDALAEGHSGGKLVERKD